VKPLNFPQPEELAEYTARGKQRSDERGLPISVVPEQPAAAALGASPRLPLKRSGRKVGKSGFFGVKKKQKNKSTQWTAAVHVPCAEKLYTVGHFPTKEAAARAYDAEVRRRGWTHLKWLNFPDPADGTAAGGALPPSSSAAGSKVPRPE